MIPPKYVAGGAAVLGLGALAWVLLRRRASESLARTAGRELGGAAVELVTGAAGGVKDAVVGVAESALGVQPFEVHPIKGRELSPVQTNLLGLQGRLAEPEGEDAGTYIVEVQNTSDKNLSQVRVELLIDKWGLDPIRELVAQVDLPARSGIIAKGTVLVRSVSGILPVTARLYANKYLLAKAL